MAAGTRFLFNQDFRNPAPSADVQAGLAEAEQRGYARGLAEGRRQAQAEAEARLADTVARLSEAAGRLLSGLEARQAQAEAEAMAFAVSLARKLAGEALRRQPLAAIAETARTVFQHLRGVPHLVVRVNEALTDAIDPVIRRIAHERGYEGRIVVLGEPDIPPGDARMEWADGGLVRDQRRIESTVSQMIALLYPPDEGAAPIA